MKDKRKLLLIICAISIVFCLMLLRSKQQPLSDSSHTIPLDTSSLRKINAELLTLVNTQNPRVALEKLADMVRTDPRLASSCHPIAHNIGHEAFKKYKSFGVAMTYQNETCNSGYLHGVIESYFKQMNDITSVMTTLCQQYTQGSFISWECFHGLGHGVMFFSNNNIPLSLKACSLYKDNFSKSACENGVFMENFNTDQKVHISTYLRANNPFYPCETLDFAYKPNCYLYAPTYYLSLHKQGYIPALHWCLGAEKTYQRQCTEGIGSETMKQNINKPQFVEHICQLGEPSQVHDCITGMVSLYINYYGSLLPAQKLCSSLQELDKKTCTRVIQVNEPLFKS